MKLSIIIPCYNEKQTIEKIVLKILKVKIQKEIIIIDDFSNDGSSDIIKKIRGPNIKKIFHKKNKNLTFRLLWCPHTDLNREPIDYKSIALPIEL